MKNNLSLPQDKKLTAVVRVELGCLGPDGSVHIEEFCGVAQKEIEPIYSDFINWEIVPRFDKSLPEIQYKIINKNLTLDQAEKYLAVFHKNLDEFEGQMQEKLASLIDQYLRH